MTDSTGQPQASDDPPDPRAWTVAVDSQNRIVLKKRELLARVPWFAKLDWKPPKRGGTPSSEGKTSPYRTEKTASCVGLLVRQIPRLQLLFPNREDLSFWSKFAASVPMAESGYSEPTELAEDVLSLARYWAMNRLVTVVDRGGTYRMTLPEGFRNMEVVPSYAGKVTVFAFQGICEIWRADRWAKSAGGWEAIFQERREEILRSLTEVGD